MRRDALEHVDQWTLSFGALDALIADGKRHGLHQHVEVWLSLHFPGQLGSIDEFDVVPVNHKVVDLHSLGERTVLSVLRDGALMLDAVDANWAQLEALLVVAPDVDAAHWVPVLVDHALVFWVEGPER